MYKLIFLISVCALYCRGASPERDWGYLDNGTVRIGVDKSRGAGIGYFGESTTGRNLLNHYDEGRFVQQSYYGKEDGSNWNGKPWSYNPVQGGSWNRQPSKVLEFCRNPDAQTLYAKIEPRRWSSAMLCPEAVMEEALSLDGPVARIHFKMTYTGEDQGEPRHQEMPAVFVDGALQKFVYVKDGKITRADPRILAENGGAGKDGLQRGKSSANWVAYLDDNDWGIGICTPGTAEFTCYRAKGDGTTGPEGSACSYVAPLRTFSLTAGLVVEYDVYLTIGTLDEIQTRFGALKTENWK